MAARVLRAAVAAGYDRAGRPAGRRIVPGRHTSFLQSGKRAAIFCVKMAAPV